MKDVKPMCLWCHPSLVSGFCVPSYSYPLHLELTYRILERLPLHKLEVGFYSILLFQEEVSVEGRSPGSWDSEAVIGRFKKPIVEILKNRDRARGPMITKSHIDREKPEKRYEPPRYLSGDSLYSSKTRCTRSLSRSRIMEYKKEKHHQMSKDRSQSRSNRRRSRSVSLERSDNEKIKLHKSSLKHSRSRSRECERKVNKSDYEESEIRHRSKKKKHKKEKRHKKKKRVSHSPLGSKASDGKDYKKDKSDSP